MEVRSMDSFAKINLLLDVEGIRKDGYHNIISVMQSVSLCDTVTVEYEPSDQRIISVTCNREDVPTGEKNIAYKAVSRLIDSGKVHVHIEKRIPMAAGLAGGSADAAAVLILLNDIVGAKSPDELIELGRSIGADVPFCMVGGTKLINGIGDIACDFPKMPECFILIACSGEGVSTPWAYGEIDRLNGNFENYASHIDHLDVLKNTNADINDWARGLFNVFEGAILPQRPIAAQIKNIMLSGGAIAAMMSGSGPSVFGIFTSEATASIVSDSLKDRGIVSHLCTAK